MKFHLVLVTLVTVIFYPYCGLSARYQAPDPSNVHFPYRRVPTMNELIEDAGHHYNRYNVTTDDGHILALHRITSRRKDHVGGLPVLFVVGYGFQSESWMVLGNASLPFVLTELGYDVWLGDPRGCIRSLEHTSYTLDDWRTMNYTFHERGVYDVPAFIDKILDTTGSRQLLYVGHSLGAGALIIMSSERPEYSDKILAATIIAPAGHFLKWENNPLIYRMALRNLVSFTDGLKRVKQLIYPAGNKELQLAKQYTGQMCGFPVMSTLCRLTQYITIGITDTVNWRSYFYQVATSFTSVHLKTTEHVLQNIKRGRFVKYDFGIENNLRIYGQEFPPTYALNSTNVPVYMVYGGNDLNIAPRAAERTGRELGNLKGTTFLKNFNHFDFMISPSAPQAFFKNVVDFFDSFQTKMPKQA